jgi:AcrR family transcriptional regulator
MNPEKQNVTSREERTQHILETALRVWKQDHYSHTSLAALARELGFSKTALYRYFPGKDGLLQTLSQSVREKFVSDRDAVLTGIAASGEDALERYLYGLIELGLRFLSDLPERFAFVEAVLTRPSFPGHTEAVQTAWMLVEQTKAVVQSRYQGINSEALTQVVQFLLISVSYWISLCYYTPQFELRTEEEARELVTPELNAGIVRACLFGLSAPGRKNLHPDEAHGGRFWPGEESISIPDRFFSVIEEVVSDLGFTGATVEQIASRIGISKSSLYFYFKNRDDMLGRMLQKEYDHFFSVLEPRLAQCDSPEERMLCYLLVTSSYYLYNPVFLTVAAWVKAQSVAVNVPTYPQQAIKDKLGYMLEGLDLSGLPTCDNPISIIQLYHLLVSYQMLHCDTRPDSDAVICRTRTLYSLLISGVSGTFRNHTEHSECAPEAGLQNLHEGVSR